MIVWIYKAVCRIVYILIKPFEKIGCAIVLNGNNVRYGKYRSSGIPYISVAIGGFCAIGDGFAMNNGKRGNPIGCYQRCTIVVNRGAKLVIGDHVGVSQTAIVCHTKIMIGNYVKIGGGVCIYDTDFHSLNPKERKDPIKDRQGKAAKPIIIEDNAFIGAHSTILKGVTIGENAIIGACSVVTKDVPANEIWAGNPARFIRKI